MDTDNNLVIYTPKPLLKKSFLCHSYKPFEHRLSRASYELLDYFRHNLLLCDAIIQVDDGSRFPIHRVILSASSSYFRALFTNGLNETSCKLINIQGIDSDIMRILLDWIYTKDILINSNNIERLLLAADQFQELKLLDKCIEFLEKNIVHENVVGMWKFARIYEINNLAEAAFDYLMKNFKEVVKNSKEIFELSQQDMLTIIRCSDLNVKTELVTIDFINRWIDFDHEIRIKYRLRLENSLGMMRQRIPHELLIVTGGWSNGSPTNLIEIYNCRTNVWTRFKEMIKGPLAYHGSVTLEKSLYLIGGYDGIGFLNNCKMFDFQTAAWKEIAPMHQKRCYTSTAVYNGEIYALGGFDGLVRFNSAEKFSPQTNQWTVIAPMNEARSDSSAAEYGGKIYVCGGFNGNDYLSSAECYDPETNVWTYLRSMSCKRSGVGVVGFQGSIYALGGYDGDNRLKTCEKYQIRDGKWKEVADMKSPRSNFGVEVLEDNVYVIGGFNGFTTILSTEFYSEENDEWFLKAQMNSNRSALSACILKGIKYIKPYL